MMNVKKKNSGRFRDRATDEAGVLIRLISQQSGRMVKRIIEAINAVFNNNPWLPENHMINF